VSLTAVAAFAAAGLSLVSVIINVILTARLAGRSKREEWRRDYVLPIASEFLAEVAHLHERQSRIVFDIVLHDSVVTEDDGNASAEVDIAVNALDSAVVRLELTASRQVATAASKLWTALKGESLSLLGATIKGQKEHISFSGTAAEAAWFPADLGLLRRELARAVRLDIGLPD
jgi:hypothetical protein